MTEAEAVDAILGVFKAYWDAQSSVGAPVYDDVTAPTPLPQAPWARAYVQHHWGGQRSLTSASGQILYTNTGTVFVEVFAPIGAGKVRARSLAGGVVRAYRLARNLDVWFRNHRLQEAGESGQYTQVNVMVNFNYDSVE